MLQHREHYIDGRKVDAKAAVPKDQGGGKLTRKMFVGGIGEVSDAEFQAHFANFGAMVVSAPLSALSAKQRLRLLAQHPADCLPCSCLLSRFYAPPLRAGLCGAAQT